MKKVLPDIIAILAFIAISYVYFLPAVWEGRILFQNDTVAGVGAGQEAIEYYEQNGERTRWTNSIFGGMPTYQISPSYDSTTPLSFVGKVYHLFLPDYVWYIFVMMLGFYILLRAFGVSVWLSTLGGVIWGFSSYFFILISAQHIWKLITLAYIPPTIAGIVLVYRKKYILGAVVTALFIALQILSNHVQMTYYFLFVILFMVIAFFVDAYQKKELPEFFKASAILIVAGLIGVSTNISNLYHTYEYSKETMRGKSELKQEGVAAAQQTSSGLDRDYITHWSYGIGETFTLMIPNTKGGASVPLSHNPKAMEKANPMYSNLYSQFTQYWGDQPMTSGPVYVGAFVVMLFILGIFIVEGPMKWALVGATVLSILLSWGRNFMGLTDFFIDYIPMYSKFRAVSSILVIAEFTIPLLAIFALKEIFEKPQILKEKMKYVYISFGVTAGLALLFAIAPKLFFSSYIPAAELSALQRGLPAEHLAPFIANLEEVRISLFTADTWRSFFIIVIGTLLLLLYRSGKLKTTWTIGAIVVLCLVDMWQVNKRYLSDDQFIPATQKMETFKLTEADKIILEDKSLDYRVLNLSTSPFSENITSYWHKNVAGYHAAKLRRYQEMIDRYIGSEMQNVYSGIATAEGNMADVDPNGFPILNMLNTKYFILPAGEGKTIPIQNPYTFGNAWFVENVKYVNNANEEIDALATVQLTETAVADARFKEALNGMERSTKDSLASMRITSYQPNHLIYESSSEQGGVVVFSEIYYPGWKATIDGQPAEIGRANYILRAMNIPAGKHTIEMRFDPTSLKVTEGIAYGGLALLLIGVIVLLLQYRKTLNGKE
ncbi:YfhO family protein [Bacteroides sp. 51]|uniref:YfhO family protein n=1 Tax=Bacteroides sp. 51 TaxID=2302938 RepID=UPI0013D7F8A7|nr:YfhO family protein [Bacteroides sp. 51]NDV82039.1 hypothetical protein [Bacteroides sp. 51]